MSLSRRQFLNTVVLSASAVAVTSMVGCGSSDDDDPVVTPSPAGCTFSSDVFPQSVMSGDPRQNSVILWTRINDACELEAGKDLKVTVQVSTVNNFDTTVVNAEVDVLAEYDHNIKLRITGLDADTRYYYRFVYTKDTTPYTTNLGRTRTAPEADSARSVRFAYVSCQDYVGRYYNNYLSLLTAEMLTGEGVDGSDGLDFVVHLGDYIYETTGDPDFQASAGARVVSFKDQAGALKLGAEGKEFYAAQSLDNYRELYKTYKTDELLQKVQENFPVIVTWDDHEFSDDSWQDTATYLNGAPGEKNLQRKKNSERAYFECMPIDHEFAFDAAGTDVVGTANVENTDLAITDEQLFPNTKIYRDFTFGSKVHLLMSDFRSHRPDHLIEEDAFPGRMAMTEQNVIDTIAATQSLTPVQAAGYFATIKDNFDAYIDIDDEQYSAQKFAIRSAAAQSYKDAAAADGVTLSGTEIAGLLGSQIQGMQSVSFLNIVLEKTVASGALPSSITYDSLKITAAADAPRGVSFFILGKQSFFSEIGTRYFVVQSTFDLFAAYKTLVAAEKTPMPFGTDQATWLATRLQTQIATNKTDWRILGSSVSFSPLVLDLRPTAAGRSAITAADVTAITGITVEQGAGLIAGGLEQTIEGLSADQTSPLALLANRFYLNVDHWDGFPVYKKGLMSDLATNQDLLGQTGVITIAGDVHSSYIGKQPASSTGARSFDLTTSSISSGTFGQFMNDAMDGIMANLAANGATLSAELQEGLALLKSNWSVLVQTANDVDADTAKSTELKRARLNEHGLVTVVAEETTIDFTYHAIADSGDLVTKSYYATDDQATFLNAVNKTTYRIENNDIDELVPA